jgi:hypothetical protein
MTSTRRVIRASEIGEYIYCHRAWWLRHLRGHRSANVREMAEGSSVHAGHGRTVWLGRALQAAAILLLALAAIFFFVSLLSPP